MLQINIEITVVNASNTKRRRNAVLMFGVADSDTALNQQRSQNPEILNSNQSLIIKITKQYLKWSPKKRTKRSPNIIVTLKVTLLI